MKNPLRPFAAFIVLLPLAKACAAPPQAEFLSDRPELIVNQSQSWGELGFDVAAHAAQAQGEPLRIGQRSYAKGMGHHANGKIVVLLGGEFTSFETEVGLQPCAGGGSVVFRVVVDGKTQFDSGIMHAGDEARPLALSIVDAQEMILEADDAGDGITCDMANWANSRLVPAPESHRGAPKVTVDIARFAQVTTSDPDRVSGSQADRLQEYRTEDVFLETELERRSDGGFEVMANHNGIACLGLKWFSPQTLREVRLTIADAVPWSAAKEARLEGWFGESAWQGRWLPLKGDQQLDGNELAVRLSPLGPDGRLLQTRKIRWVLPVRRDRITVKGLAAYGRTRWEDVQVVIETERPEPGSRGTFRVFNGELLSAKPVGRNQTGDLSSSGSSAAWAEWDLSQSLALGVRGARLSASNGDPTVLQFRFPAGGVGVSLEDLRSHGCVYVPSHRVFVALADGSGQGQSLAAYKQSISGRKTVLEEVRQLPDQTLSQAMAKTHHEAQSEGPVMLSLACDNTKFVVDRGGAVHFQPEPGAPSEWFAAAAVLEPRFADGAGDRFERHLEGGWLPIPVITVRKLGIDYTQRTFVAPDDEIGEDTARLNRRSLCVVEFTAHNSSGEAAEARMELRFKPGTKLKQSVELIQHPSGHAIKFGQISALLATDESAPLNTQAGPGTLILSGSLPPNGRAKCVVFLGEQPAGELRAADVGRLRNNLESYWRAVLAPGAQIQTPDRFLDDVIRSSQVRCYIAARNEANGSRIAPWIAAMSYGPLESEAHSVIRGMDVLGHRDFARRGLEYFVHRYNTNGFLTTGYTTFGTAWHLWTLGEHFQLTGDKEWLRQIAPALDRAGDWILRQKEKTKRWNGSSQPVPEYGLMPPAVMADWNAFAYHFMLDAYYHAALRELGSALGSIGDPHAGAFTLGARELRGDLLRAYHWTQEQSPVLPLRNGTWIPHYPSQLFSPGKLAGFFPGADAGRSWAYDVELGAHQLAPAGVLAPNDPEVTRLLDHMEDVQFLADGWFDYPAALNHQDWFNLGGFAKVQPYYARNCEIYALRDEIKPFLRSYFNSLAALLNPEVLTFWEHFHHNGAWDKTHETGYFLYQTRTMLVQERGEELWLAPFVTSNWLRDGMTLAVSNAPTRFGKVSYRIASHIKDGYMEATIDPPTRRPPASIVLRLRHPDDKSLRSVSINGKASDRFDTTRACIRVPVTQMPTTVVAHF